MLIANPNLTSVNSLLSPGQKLSIGLINPQFTLVEISEVVQDVSTSYATITETDPSLYINETIGTKSSWGGNYLPPAASTTDWGWPTISPYVITSKFGWRWGRLHGAIDISGSGFGSPIFAATSGTVIKLYDKCPDRGYYGSSCGGQFGNYVEIE